MEKAGRQAEPRRHTDTKRGGAQGAEMPSSWRVLKAECSSDVNEKLRVLAEGGKSGY